MSKIEVRWEAEDGYAGGSRPQKFKIDLDEMVRDCETERDAELFIDEEVADDFAQKITPWLKNQEEILEAWRVRKAEKERGE